ncbi:hypothetical protein VaNZ11_002796, partial [Volvox africanus]
VASVSCQNTPPPLSAPDSSTTSPRIQIVNASDYGIFIDVYGDGQVFDSANLTQLVNLVNRADGIRRIGLHGLDLPDPLPAAWVNLSSLRTLMIDCVGDAGAGMAAASATGGSSSAVLGRFLGSKEQFQSLKQLISSRMNSTVSNIRNVTIINCGVQGHYGELWRDYLSSVQVVNLSGNALTGDLKSIDYFDTACNDTFAGDDYGDPDCALEQTLDVSRNQLSGPISTGAWLGDDVTDAICSTACISLVLASGVTDEEVLCRAPLLIYAMDNPGLVYREGMNFGSGYVTLDHSNWCFIPASRWVLPTMWAIFLTMMVATLSITLYARVRLKRVPFRMKPATFEVLQRGTIGSPGSLNGRSSCGRDASLASGGYVGLAGCAGALELAECQAMIPKASVSAFSKEAPLNRGSEASSRIMAPQTSVNVIALQTATLPVSSPPMLALAPPLVNSGTSASSRGSRITNSVGLPDLRQGSSGKQDPNGIRVALTAGFEDSSDSAGGGLKPRLDAVRELDLELCDDSDRDPRSGSSSNGLTLEARAAMATGRASGGGSAAVAALSGSECTWKTFLWGVLLRGLEILGMQLRTLLILGMFGLECYWAYGLILYRGGWQLLLLIPNYLEQTLGGIAMLRAFMAGTHGRWKYVAPVPLLPFTMAAVYLVYGFIAYPFGWADLGPVSWEKFIDLMDSCGVLSSTCWAIYSSLAYWRGNSVNTSYQYFNTYIFVAMMIMCFTDLLSTAHHLASTLQVPFKQWLRRELDVRKIKVAVDKSHRLQGDGNL